MAKEYVYPKWVEKAWKEGLFNFNIETGGWKYNNPKYERNYKFELNPKKDYNIKRGDTICFGGRVYRNDGVWIWDGEKIIELETDIDDYGSVPNSFKVGKEFHPNHWIKIIDHNTIIWLEDDLFEKIEFDNFTDHYENHIEHKTLNASIIIFDQKYIIDIIIYKYNDKSIQEIKDIIIKDKPCFQYEAPFKFSLFL
jgi:hypothetical protein